MLFQDKCPQFRTVSPLRSPFADVLLNGSDASTNPCETMVKVREGDPAREALAAVMAQWKSHLGPGQSRWHYLYNTTLWQRRARHSSENIPLHDVSSAQGHDPGHGRRPHRST